MYYKSQLTIEDYADLRFKIYLLGDAKTNTIIKMGGNEYVNLLPVLQNITIKQLFYVLNIHILLFTYFLKSRTNQTTVVLTKYKIMYLI